MQASPFVGLPHGWWLLTRVHVHGKCKYHRIHSQLADVRALCFQRSSLSAAMV